MLFGAARANVLLRGKLNCLLRGWGKKKEEEEKRPPNLSKTLNNWQKELCLLDRCPTQQWAFLRVLWHHLRQLRFSEFLIVAPGEESSVQLSLLWDKRKKIWLVKYAKVFLVSFFCCFVFCFVLFLNATKGVGPRILSLSLMTLLQRQKSMNTVHWISQSISICPQLNKNHQVCFHFTSLGWMEISPWISSFSSILARIVHRDSLNIFALASQHQASLGQQMRHVSQPLWGL